MNYFYLIEVETEESWIEQKYISTSFTKAKRKIPEMEAWDGFGCCTISKIDEDFCAHESWRYERGHLVAKIVYKNPWDYECWKYDGDKIVEHYLHFDGEDKNLMHFDENAIGKQKESKKHKEKEND